MSNIIIFDLDGTLAISGKQISTKMLKILTKLNKLGYQLVIVSGGKYEKIKWQLNDNIKIFYRIFSECGALCYDQNKLVYHKDITKIIEPKLLNTISSSFINKMDSLQIDYVGERVDIRSGLIYLAPVGMGASEELRNKFIKLEEQTQFRDDLIKELKIIDDSDNLEIVKGGKTGVAIYPKGLDKTQILEHLQYDQLWFFGDNCKPDGNDYCLYTYPGIKSYEVQDYKHCIRLLKSLFIK